MNPFKERPKFLAIGRVVKPQGRGGEVAAEVLTDFDKRFEGLKRVFLECLAGDPVPVEIERAWSHKGRIILKLRGIDKISEAAVLRDRHILIPLEERMMLSPDRYYTWELEGCTVVIEHDGGETVVGIVTGVEPTGGVDLLHVAKDGVDRGNILIPLAKDICRRIDVTAKRIVIDPPEDLLDLNADGGRAESLSKIRSKSFVFNT